MLRVDPQTIITQYLDEWALNAINEASQRAVGNGHQEVTVEHFLLEMLKQPAGDIARICSYFSVERESIILSIEQVLEHYRKGADTLPVFAPLLAELLQDSWLLTTTDFNNEKIRCGTIFLSLLLDPYRFCHYSYIDAFKVFSTEKIRSDFDIILLGSMENDGVMANASSAAAGDISPDGYLTKYAKNIVTDAKEGKIDPVFCRDVEISSMIDILVRRRKNNPIIVGEAGVGKTALVEGLALKIASGDVPPFLKDYQIYELDLGSLQAGASVQGEFEKRLKGVIDEVKESTTPIILFIDEAHTLIGAGGAAGGGDAANLLKPALARGELRTIAATTWSEYKKYFEKDPALTRRFQLIKADEPSIEDSVRIIEGLTAVYEKVHNVYITGEAIHAAAELSARYIAGRQLPDKAIDLLDTASARVQSSQDVTPRPIDYLEKKQKLLERESETILRDISIGMVDDDKLERKDKIDSELEDIASKLAKYQDRFEKEKSLIDEFFKIRKKILAKASPTEEKQELAEDNEKQVSEETDQLEALASAFEKDEKKEKETQQLEYLTNRLNELRQQISEIQGEEPLIHFEVGVGEIASVIADWTGIPASSMSSSDKEKFLNLRHELKKDIIGQDHAIDAISDRMLAARVDLKKADAPNGVFLLVGPSGTGKTETALQLAEHLFGSKQFLTSINMSEYQEKHTVSRLIGSPPGYVGYGEGGILTEAIRKHPYSIVLLDEVEKADPEVMNLFYQAFDKGMLNDGEGREIDCKNIVFVLTSNLGSEVIMEHYPDGNVDGATLEELIMPSLNNHFKPALLARMHIIGYRLLSKEAMDNIIALKLNHLKAQLQEIHKMTLKLSPPASAALRRLCNRQEKGARMVDHIIERKLLPEISQLLLSKGNDDGKNILFIGLNDDAEFRFEHLSDSEMENHLSADEARIEQWKKEAQAAKDAANALAQKAIEEAKQEKVNEGSDTE